jgi:transcriptional regulator with PAS, ATPase and Fis domain
MIFKTYKIIVSFGDGKPVESTIEARNGILAQDLALVAFPGARSIRVLGVVSERFEKPVVEIQIQRPDLVVQPEEEEQMHPLFTDKSFKEIKRLEEKHKRQQMEECFNLHRSGLSHKTIAGQLGIGKTTVGRWIKEVRAQLVS